MSINQNKYNLHSYFMRLALFQAQKIIGNTKENPAVGCVITKNNIVVSAGSTGINGRPHAEYNAIKIFNNKLDESTLYATLEPCSHYGKTPPCVKLIIKKKIKKVFFSINDPDPRSFKKSKFDLNKKKIKVIRGLSSKQIGYFYRSYLKSKKNNLPFVTCKLALSKDYFTINKKYKWITNQYSRSRGHLLRSMHDCLLTSSQTILKDNSQLTCRINGLSDRTPTIAILDNNLKLNTNLKVFKNFKKNRIIIFHNKINKKKMNTFKILKVKFLRVPLNKDGDLDLKKILLNLKKLGFSRILLESGRYLTTNFLNENLVDDLNLFISNKKLNKNGSGSLKKYLVPFLKNKKKITIKVNLFGDSLFSYKLK